MQFIAPILTLAGFSVVFFGGFARFSIGFLFLWNDRLGAPYWPWLVIASAVCVAPVARYLIRSGYGWSSISSIVLGVFLALSVLSVGTYAELLRRQAVAEFAADRAFQNSFWQSLRNAPDEWQFFLHAGAMKDCVPYAWSYRTMAMYELPESAMFNVLPGKWFAECGMERRYLD